MQNWADGLVWAVWGFPLRCRICLDCCSLVCACQTYCTFLCCTYFNLVHKLKSTHLNDSLGCFKTNQFICSVWIRSKSIRLFWSAPECDYCVCACLNKPHQGGKPSRVLFRRTKCCISESTHNFHEQLCVVDQRQKQRGQIGCERQAEQKVRAEFGEKTHPQLQKWPTMYQNTRKKPTTYICSCYTLSASQFKSVINHKKGILSKNEMSWVFFICNILVIHFIEQVKAMGEKVAGNTPLSPYTCLIIFGM